MGKKIDESNIKKQIEKCKCNVEGCTASIKNGKLRASSRDGMFLTAWCYCCNIYITKILSI